jgi:septum formation protein
MATLTSAASTVPTADRAIVITCDTIVVLDGHILEKPVDQADARRMLAQISGRTHTVISGVCVAQVSGSKALRAKVFKVETQVTIKPLSTEEIAAYVATGEPMDKAGSYAAQGIGAYMIDRIEGSYSNVVGLPLTELVQCLRDDFDVHLW